MANRPNGDLALARRIRAAGCHIFIQEDDEKSPDVPPDTLFVRMAGGGPNETMAIEFEAGVAFIIDLTITMRVSAFAIAGFDLELPWQKLNFQWLPDPLETEGTKFYQFSRRFPLTYDRRLVLNHHADVRRVFQRGKSISGLLLGTCAGSIPDEFRTGTFAPAAVIIIDQYCREFRFPIELFISKREKRGSGGRAAVRRRGNLFDKPDWVSEDANADDVEAPTFKTQLVRR